MIQESVKYDSDVAMALLEIVPKLLRRIRADLPLASDAPATGSVWQDVSELSATPGQLTLLSVLVEHERCMMQELAEYLAVAPSTATAMVKRLLAQGYVERSRDDADWRTVWVKPTEARCQAVHVFHQARLASLKFRLKQLSHDDQASILAALPALHQL